MRAPVTFFRWGERPRAEDLRGLCTDTLAKCTPEQLRILYRVLLASLDTGDEWNRPGTKGV